MGKFAGTHEIGFGGHLLAAAHIGGRNVVTAVLDFLLHDLDLGRQLIDIVPPGGSPAADVCFETLGVEVGVDLGPGHRGEGEREALTERTVTKLDLHYTQLVKINSRLCILVYKHNTSYQLGNYLYQLYNCTNCTNFANLDIPEEQLYRGVTGSMSMDNVVSVSICCDATRGLE